MKGPWKVYFDSLKNMYGVGKKKDGILWQHPAGVIFADLDTAQRFADELNGKEEEENAENIVEGS